MRCARCGSDPANFRISEAPAASADGFGAAPVAAAWVGGGGFVDEQVCGACYAGYRLAGYNARHSKTRVALYGGDGGQGPTACDACGADQVYAWAKVRPDIAPGADLVAVCRTCAQEIYGGGSKAIDNYRLAPDPLVAKLLREGAVSI